MLRQRKSDRLISKSHVHAPKQEKRLAKQFGGRTTSGSGSKDEKGDVIVAEKVVIEAKSTQNKSYSLTRALVKKMENESMSKGKIPTFQIDFLNGENIDCQLAVIPMWAFEMLLDEVNSGRERK